MTRLPPSRFALRRTSRSFHVRTAGYVGQGAGSARQAPRLASLTRGTVRLVLGAVWTAAFVMIAGGSTVLACPVCFGAEETSMIDGARLGVMVMLAITFAVQGGFVGFFLYLRKRAKRNADVELDAEWSELQKTP